MAKTGPLVERIIEELTGNEALLEMLETEPAKEMLDWGLSMTGWIVENLREEILDETALLPRLKALRQTMRTVGNWAAGKYAEPSDRINLRDKLLKNLRLIFGDEARLPSADEMDRLLNEVDHESATPQKLISSFRATLESKTAGGPDAQA